MALAKLTIGDLIAFKEKRRPTNVKVICLEHSNTIGQALKVLAKYRILSAPLIMAASLEDMAEESVEGGRTGAPALIGWVDINDILHALLSFVKKQHEGQIPTSMLLLMSALEAAARPFNDRALITLSGGDDKSLVYETEADASLLQTINGNLLNNAGRPDKVLHRLAVFDASGEVKHVISHLDIVNLLSAQHSTLLGEFADKTLEELALLPSGPGHVVCVDPHVPTLIALDRMATAGVSGAAVVTAAGELVANLSTSDLRGIQPEHLGVLALPVAEFLALLHGTTYLGWAQTSSKQADHPFFANRRRGAPGSPGRAHDAHDVDAVRLVTCSATSPLKEALAKMADNHVHRVYVTDPAAKPQVTAVVTPTDILKWLVTVFQAGN